MRQPKFNFGELVRTKKGKEFVINQIIYDEEMGEYVYGRFREAMVGEHGIVRVYEPTKTEEVELDLDPVEKVGIVLGLAAVAYEVLTGERKIKVTHKKKE